MKLAQRELQVINTLINKISRTRNADSIMSMIIDEMVMVTNADEGIINLISSDGLKTVVRGKKTTADSLPFKLDNMICNWVLENKKMIRIDNLDADDRFPGMNSADGRYASIICYPMFVRDEIIGLTSLVGSRERGPFSDENCRIVGIIASQSAQILSNALLLEELARKNEALQQQLIQVKELSAKTIEQERLAKEQEMKHKLLRQELSFQAKELENARELEKTHEELKQAHIELKNAQAQLVQAEKMASLGMLVAGVAHEINTPMGAAKSMHDTLMRGVKKIEKTLETDLDKDDERARSFQATFEVIQKSNAVIEEGYRRVNGIVKKLRRFARLDEAELKKADIHEGLDDTLALLSHDMGSTIQIRKNYGRVPPIPCFMDQLNQVFVNVLMNAKQAIQGEGEIAITTFIKNEKVFIEFADSGIGIPEDKIHKIFDPGFTTKGVGVGTGLGLSICYRIIQDHHGEIQVESKIGKGTKITIILPMNLDALLNAKEK